MYQSVAPMLWVLMGHLIGAAISWLVANSRQRASLVYDVTLRPHTIRSIDLISRREDECESLAGNFL